jgi:hypothetical protein
MTTTRKNWKMAEVREMLTKRVTRANRRISEIGRILEARDRHDYYYGSTEFSLEKKFKAQQEREKLFQKVERLNHMNEIMDEILALYGDSVNGIFFCKQQPEDTEELELFWFDGTVFVKEDYKDVQVYLLVSDF